MSAPTAAFSPKRDSVLKFSQIANQVKNAALMTSKIPDYSSNWLGVKAKVLGFEAQDLYNEIDVLVSTVDKVVAENKITKIFLLKIDTEGGELNVIKGAVEALRMGIIKNIQLESHNNDLRTNNKIEIFQLLSNYTHQKTIKHYFGSFTEEFFSLTKDNLVNI
jgi:FkbM family methyltransferase